MKKFIQKIICYTSKEVIDVETKHRETATYVKLFGFVVKTTYRPKENCDHSNYLGII